MPHVISNIKDFTKQNRDITNQHELVEIGLREHLQESSGFTANSVGVSRNLTFYPSLVSGGSPRGLKKIANMSMSTHRTNTAVENHQDISRYGKTF